jgi:hypothetical protein
MTKEQRAEILKLSWHAWEQSRNEANSDSLRNLYLLTHNNAQQLLEGDDRSPLWAMLAANLAAIELQRALREE